MVKCTKDEYWHSKWAIGRFSSQKLEKLLSAHVNWMLATGLLAGRFVSYLDFLHITSCSRVLGSLTDTGMAVSHFCQTRGKSKPAVAARQLALWKDFSCTHSGLLSHTYQWPRTSSSLLIFSHSQLSVWMLACACECLAVYLAACAYIHICWPCVCVSRGLQIFVCLLTTSSALMRQVTVWVWAMEQSVSRPTVYRLALHDNMVGRTLVNRTKEGGKKGQWMEEERDPCCL